MASFFQACSTMPPVPPDDAPVQQCMVCRYKRDFSCLQVKREPGTPQSDYQGRHYCFCSEECREEFQHSPEKYKARSR